MELLATGFDSPEGPCFDREGNLFFVNWLSSSINRLAPDGTVTEFFNTGGIPAGLAFHPDGSLWVADEGDGIHGVMRIATDGTSAIVVNQYDGQNLNGANDLVFDPNGVLYFSDPWRSSRDNPIGGFYRYFPDGRLERIDTGLAFPNGVAINAANSHVFLAETGPQRILRYAINPDGSLGPREYWAELRKDGTGPDGMAFDRNGHLYVAHYGGGRVDVLDVDGTQIDEIAVPGRNVTNCAFGGPGNQTLVVTDVETGALFRTTVAVGGQPLHDGRQYG